MAKLLHLIHTPRHSGAEILVRDLCMTHAGQGVECAVASFEPMTDEFRLESERLTACGVLQFYPEKPLKKLQRIKYFRSVFRNFGPDLVYGHSVLPSFYGRLALPLSGHRPRFITVLHSATNDDFSGLYFTALEHALGWRTDEIFAVSSRGAENYRRRFGGRIPVQVVPNGIDTARFQNVDRPSARSRLEIDDKTRVILQVGRLSKVKQQDLSIRALSDYLKSTQTELWLVGLTEEPEYERHLRALVSENDLQNKVRFLGSRADVPDLLAASDLYLMPSRAEAHSIALVEALVSGIPMVISDIGVFEAYRHWSGVRIVPVDSGELLLSASQRLVASGRHSRWIEDLDIHFTADRYLGPLTGGHIA